MIEQTNKVKSILEFMKCSLLSLDFETYDLDNESLFNTKKPLYTMKLFSVAGKFRGKIISGAFEPEMFGLFWNDNKNKTIIFHNAKYDLKVIKRVGYDIDSIKFEDTMIMSHLLNETRDKGLKDLRVSVLGKQQRDKYSEVNQYNKEAFEKYAELDAVDTFELYENFSPQIKSEDLTTVYEIEKQAILPTLEMEYYGIRIDTDLLLKQREILSDILTPLKEKLQDIYKIDIKSPKQISELLFEKFNYKPLEKWKNKETGNISVDKWTLNYIAKDVKNTQASDFVKALLDYRKFETIFTSFNTSLMEKLIKGRIYTNFNGQGTVGSRYSSSGPNLQNQPRDYFLKDNEDTHLRKLYMADEGNLLVGADFSQIELRVMAELSRDKNFCNVYREDKDLHQATADLVGCSRSIAKNINFGIGYGFTSYGLMEQINNTAKDESLMINEEQATEFINKFWESYPKVKSMFDYVDKSLQSCHYVRDFAGRKRRWDIITNASLREAHNYLIQSSAGELTKLAMINIYKNKDHKRAKIVLTVHDEIISNVEESYVEEYKELKKESMEKCIDFSIPIKAEVKSGKTWFDCK